MIRSVFYTSAWSAIFDVAPVSSFAYGLQLTSNGSGYGLVWLDEFDDGVDIYDVVHFDFYNGNSWYNRTNTKPTRLSLPKTDTEGNFDFTFRPRITSNGSNYAVNWYGQNNVGNTSNIFSAVMTSIDVITANINWNGPKRISANGNPSTNVIVSNGAGYLSTWDAADVSNIADYYVYSNLMDTVNWQSPPPGPANDIVLGEASSPIPFATSSGYAIVWTLTGIGMTSDDVYGRVYLGGTWKSRALLSDPALGTKRWLTINGSGNQFIAAWAQGPNVGFPIAYVNRYDGTTWEANPLALEDPMTVTSASSDVKTVPLGNGHYMATWLKEVSPGVERLDSKFIQAP